MGHPPFLFVVGSGRSGTTLARTMLDAHPDLAIPDETHFVPRLARHRRKYERDGGFDGAALLRDLEPFHQFARMGLDGGALRGELASAEDYPDAIRRIYATYARARGKSRYGDKTPRYCLDMPMLALLFPEGRFVHVVRDGRAVALSVRGVSFGPDTIGGAALYWRNRALGARRTGEWLDPGRYLEYRHEELVADPEPILRAICDLIEVPYDDAMLRYHETAERSEVAHHPHVHEPPRADLRDWRTELSAEELRLVEILVGDALDELGYERATDDRTLAAEDEQRLRQEAKKLRRHHAAWEAKAFGFVTVPAVRGEGARRRFARAEPDTTPDEG